MAPVSRLHIHRQTYRRECTYTHAHAHAHTHTCTPTIPSLQPRRILIEWQETRTEWSGKDMMSATTNNKRCKGASFPKLFQKCKMGTKTLHFLLWAELSESALLQHPRQRVLWTVTPGAIWSIKTGEWKHLIYKQQGSQRKTKLKCTGLLTFSWLLYKRNNLTIKISVFH